MTCASFARRCECGLFHDVDSLSLSFEQFPSTFLRRAIRRRDGFSRGKNTGDRSRASEKKHPISAAKPRDLGEPEISISCVKHLVPATPLIQANLTNELRSASGMQDVFGLLSIADLTSSSAHLRMCRMAESFSSKLAGITLPDVDGRPTRLGSLWVQAPAVVVFLRHYG